MSREAAGFVFVVREREDGDGDVEKVTVTVDPKTGLISGLTALQAVVSRSVLSEGCVWPRLMIEW